MAEEQQPQAGTEAAKPQGSGEAGTAAGATQGSGAKGGEGSGETLEQKAARLERERDEERGLRLKHQDKVELANKVLAQEASRQAAAARPQAPARWVDAIGPQHVERYREAAQSDDPNVQAWGIGMLAALEIGDGATRAAGVTRQLLAYPEADRPAIEQRLREGKSGTVEEAAQAVKLEKLQPMQQELEASRRRIAELEQRQREVEAGTHMRSAGGGPEKEPEAMTVSDLGKLYRGTAADVAKARAFERREARGEARILPG